MLFSHMMCACLSFIQFEMKCPSFMKEHKSHATLDLWFYFIEGVSFQYMHIVLIMSQGHFASPSSIKKINGTSHWFVKGLMLEIFNSYIRPWKTSLLQQHIRLEKKKNVANLPECSCSISIFALPCFFCLSLLSTVFCPPPSPYRFPRQLRYLLNTHTG